MRTRATLLAAVTARPARRSARRRGRARAGGRPKHRGGGVRLLGARRGEVSQIGAPCPDHLINTKHRPLVVDFDPRPTRPPSWLTHSSGGRGVRRVVSEYYDRNVDDETRQFPIDPAGPRVILVPGVGIVTRAGRGTCPRLARSLPPRHRGRRRGRRARRVPVAERGRGVRDRVLAARALQARSGTAARRARRPGRGDHRRSERDRTRTARVLAARGAHVVVADLNFDGAAGGRRRDRRRVRASPCARSARRRDERGGSDRHDPPHSARVRGPRHTGRVRRARDERVGDRDEARGLGAQLRGARSRLLPRGPRGVPRVAQQATGGSVVFVALEERARRGSERGRVLVGEGGVAAPCAMPRGRRRPARHPRQHRQSGRGDRGLEHLVVRLEGRAGKHIRRQPRTSCRPSTRAAPSSVWPFYPEDVAEAIAFFAGPRSDKSTGNIINVDGGVTAAYPR